MQSQSKPTTSSGQNQTISDSEIQKSVQRIYELTKEKIRNDKILAEINADNGTIQPVTETNRLAPHVIDKLEIIYQKCAYIERAQCDGIAKEMRINPHKIQNWFQNRRRRDRKSKKLIPKKQSQSKPKKSKSDHEIKKSVQQINQFNKDLVNKETIAETKVDNCTTQPTIETDILTQDVIDKLEIIYQRYEYVKDDQHEKIAKDIGLPLLNVQNWFQERSRDRKKIETYDQSNDNKPSDDDEKGFTKIVHKSNYKRLRATSPRKVKESKENSSISLDNSTHNIDETNLPNSPTIQLNRFNRMPNTPVSSNGECDQDLVNNLQTDEERKISSTNNDNTVNEMCKDE